MQDLFITPDNQYQRDFNHIKNYIDQQSHYLSKMTGDDLNDCKEWIKNKFTKKDPSFMKQMPDVDLVVKQKNGDRKLDKEPLSKFIIDAIRQDLIVAPTGTCYLPRKVAQSLYTPLIVGYRNDRNYEKGLMHEAKRKGDTAEVEVRNENQGNAKIKVNAISGGLASPSTVLHIRTGHSTLTSTGRISTSITNLLVEKLLANNRHYIDADVTLENLILLASQTDIDRYAKCIDIYGLVVPTVEDVIEMVKDCSQSYWRDKSKFDNIVGFVEKCNAYERCNIYYNGSMWALIKKSPHVAKDFITSIASPVTDESTLLSLEESDDVISNVYGDLKILSVYLNHERTRGYSLKELRDQKPDDYRHVATTIHQINTRLMDWKPLIDALFKIEFLPSNIYDIKWMKRKVVVTSDTDSSNFTCQEICKFITGDYSVTETDMMVTFFLTYLASLMTCQALGIMSSNMGIEAEYIRELAMKNEFYIVIHCLTPSAKNYIMLEAAQEGAISPSPNLVTKGAELRGSKISKSVDDFFVKYQQDLIFKMATEDKPTMYEVLKPVYDLETHIIESLKSGETEFLIANEIKHHSDYKLGEKVSQWRCHTLYDSVFSPIHGKNASLPYMAYSIPVLLNGKTELKNWIETISDDAIKNRAKVVIEQLGETKISTMIIPRLLFNGKKIPEDILRVMNIEKILSINMARVYLLLESFGFYTKNKYNSRKITEVFGEYIKDYEERMGITDES